jgi:hypothetical protein
MHFSPSLAARRQLPLGAAHVLREVQQQIVQILHEDVPLWCRRMRYPINFRRG